MVHLPKLLVEFQVVLPVGETFSSHSYRIRDAQVPQLLEHEYVDEITTTPEFVGFEATDETQPRFREFLDQFFDGGTELSP